MENEFLVCNAWNRCVLMENVLEVNKKSKCQIYIDTTRHDGKLSLILQSEFLTSIGNGPEPLFAKLRKTIIRFFVIKRSTVVFQ